MVDLHTLALGIAGYLGIGTLGFLFFTWIASRHGKPATDPSDGLLVNTIFVACVVPLMPLVLMAAPLIALHALLTRYLGHEPSRRTGRLPAGFCFHCSEFSTRPTTTVDPSEIPAFLRRQSNTDPFPRER